MDCEQFNALLPDLDRAGACTAASRAEALAHAESCSRCAALLCESEALDYALANLIREDSQMAAPALLETALAQRFRREKGMNSHRGVRRLVVAFAAVAAVAILALGIALRHRTATPDKIGEPEPSSSATPATTTATSATPHSPVADISFAGHRAMENSARQGIARHEASPSSERSEDYTASFVPLPYAGDAADLQDGTVVQVVLPRSALASFGVPATVYAGYSDRVPADLILNENGTPEAIRLVSQNSAQQNF